MESYNISNGKNSCCSKKTFALKLEKNDDVIEKLNEFVKEKNIAFASFNGIGAFKNTQIGLLEKDGIYKKFNYDHFVEVINFKGNIALDKQDDKIIIHAHTTLSFEKNNEIKVVAGHFFKAEVAVVLELIIDVFNCDVQKRFDEKAKINTWQI